MPFLSTLETARFVQGVCDRSVGPAFMAVVEGHALEFFRSDEVSYDFVLRVENDPAFEVFRAADRAFAEFGIDLNMVRVVLAAEDREALDAGREDGESYGYAAVIVGGVTGFVEYLREHGNAPVAEGDDPHGVLKAGDDGGLGREAVAVTADEQFRVGHQSSPVLGCGESSVRELPAPAHARRYQQVPKQVDAVVWTGANFVDLLLFVSDVNVAKRGDRFCIEPLDEPSIFAVPGDYIVRDAAGKYQCIPAVEFQSTHAVVVSL